MSGKGFGQRQPTKIDKIVESAVRYCQKRNPEALDAIFDNLFLEESRGRSPHPIKTGNVKVLPITLEKLKAVVGSLASPINSKFFTSISVDPRLIV